MRPRHSFQLCTGQVPFEGNHFAVMMAHVNQAPQAPSKLRSDLPAALEQLILAALSKEPAGRSGPPNAHEVTFFPATSISEAKL